jgi:hypothetical protein
LPQKFKHIVVVIEETEDLSRLTINELIGSFEAHKQRINQYNKQSIMEQPFQIKENFSNRKATRLHQDR